MNKMIAVSPESVAEGHGHVVDFLEQHVGVFFLQSGTSDSVPTMLLVNKNLKYGTAKEAMEGLKHHFEQYTSEYLESVKRFNETELLRLAQTLGLEGAEANKFLSLEA